MASNPDDLLVFTRKQVHEMIQECASNQSHGGFMAARALGNPRLLHEVQDHGYLDLGDEVDWRDIHKEAMGTSSGVTISKMSDQWAFVYEIKGLNPVPWKATTSNVHNGKTRHFKAAELAAYQLAIKDALTGAPAPGFDLMNVNFYFWRNAGTKHDHQADATNMQKSTEDALQGILFANDRDVRRITSEIVGQGADVQPRIVIQISRYYPIDGLKFGVPDVSVDLAGSGAAATEDFDPNDFI